MVSKSDAVLNVFTINFAPEDIEALRHICPPQVNLLCPKDDQDVLSFMGRIRIDACLVDLRPLDVQPLEIIEYINLQRRTYPIFAYTEECDPKLLFRAGQLGLDAYFKKPEEAEKLAATIADLLRAAPNLTFKLISKIRRVDCPRFVRLAIEYARRNYAVMKRAGELCETLEMSYAHFSRGFKNWTGCGFWNYVIFLRIQEAKRLLENSQLYAKEIAYKVGFGDYCHFLKVFKRYEGVTPKEYRKKLPHQLIGSSSSERFLLPSQGQVP